MNEEIEYLIRQKKNLLSSKKKNISYWPSDYCWLVLGYKENAITNKNCCIQFCWQAKFQNTCNKDVFMSITLVIEKASRYTRLTNECCFNSNVQPVDKQTSDIIHYLQHSAAQRAK